MDTNTRQLKAALWHQMHLVQVLETTRCRNRRAYSIRHGGIDCFQMFPLHSAFRFSKTRQSMHGDCDSLAIQESLVLGVIQT